MIQPLVLPCFDLSPQMALIPGGVYSIQLPLESALHLIGRYRDIIPKDADLDNVISVIKADPTPDLLSDDAAKGVASIVSQLPTFDHAMTPPYPEDIAKLRWFVLAVLPPVIPASSLSSDVVTVTRVLSIEIGASLVSFFVKAVARGVLCTKMRKNDSAITLQQPTLSIAPKLESRALAQKCEVLSDKFDDFVVAYRKALLLFRSGHKVTSLLPFNPCAVALFGNSAFFNGHSRSLAYKSLRDLNRVLMTTDDVEFIAKNFLHLIDLTCAFMPFPVEAKRDFLFELEPTKRAILLENMLALLAETLDNLQENTSYVDRWVNATSGSNGGSVVNLLYKTPNKAHESDIDCFSKPQSSATTSIAPRSGASMPRNMRNHRNQGLLAIGQDDSELESIHSFVTKTLPTIDSMPDDAKRSIEKDFKRLWHHVKSGSTSSSDANLLRNYLEIVLDVPWQKFSAVTVLGLDIDKAQKQLEKDHFGLHKVKSRLVQHLIILKLLSENAKRELEAETKTDNRIPTTTLVSSKSSTESAGAEKVARENRSPILILVGPPGTGKTSLAISIAKALGRDFQRISLGGIKDESDIRGHRRTYVGAMPGLIVQALRKAKSMNPVILLDEIDKVSGGSSNGASRINGDPAAALLEVLDPEQNSSFFDRFLGIPVDLSQVVFVCTANQVSTIPSALLDRLEILKLEAYDISEKMAIGKMYLLPRQIRRNGFSPALPDKNCVRISDELLRTVILEYSSEAGVRALERNLATICRFKAVEFSIAQKSGSPYDSLVLPIDLGKYLGPPRVLVDISAIMTTRSNNSTVGIVNGLSYNSDGLGSVLVFECVGIEDRTMEGVSKRGRQTLNMTGSLGEILEESARIGLIFVKLLVFRNLLKVFKRQNLTEKFNNTDFYLHVPYGSIPKDGPSAGVTIALLFLSLILEKNVPSDVAVTGEITLRGLVLPVGGIKAKLLGAYFNKSVARVIVPRSNRRDLIEEFQKQCDSQPLVRAKYLNSRIDIEEIWEDDAKSEFAVGLVENYFKDCYGLDVLYAAEFYDVIRHVWQEDTHADFAAELRILEHHL